MRQSTRDVVRAVANSGRLCLAMAVAVGAASDHARPARAAARRPDSASRRAAQSAPQSQDAVAPADSSRPRVVAGRVMRPAGRAVRPVPGLWVVLHRVGSDTAAPIDSMRSGRDGGFSFRYRLTGRGDAIYFVSAAYGGIAYFTPPLTRPRITGADAELTVFDTTSGAVPLHVRGRHIVIVAPRVDGSRDVVEVVELANDSTVTLIPRDGVKPTWSVGLPAGVRNFQVGQGDIPPDAVREDGGRVLVVAPFAPGLKQLSFAYRAPSSLFPLSIPLEQDVSVLEVLVEEMGADVEGARLASKGPVAVEGRAFRRFLAQDAPRNAVIRMRAPREVATATRSLYGALLAMTLGAAMLVALAISFARRRQPTSVSPAPALETAASRDAERLAQAIAHLDADFERRGDVGSAERATYVARRGELKERLAEALAAQPRAG